MGRPFTRYVQDLASSSEHTLRARIQAVDADVLATLIAFFQQVVSDAARGAAQPLGIDRTAAQQVAAGLCWEHFKQSAGRYGGAATQTLTDEL